MMFGVECLAIYIYIYINHLMTCKIHHTTESTYSSTYNHSFILPNNIIRYTSRVKNGMTNYTDGIPVIQEDYVNVQQKICSNAVPN